MPQNQRPDAVKGTLKGILHNGARLRHGESPPLKIPRRNPVS